MHLRSRHSRPYQDRDTQQFIIHSGEMIVEGKQAQFKTCVFVIQTQQLHGTVSSETPWMKVDYQRPVSQKIDRCVFRSGSSALKGKMQRKRQLLAQSYCFICTDTQCQPFPVHIQFTNLFSIEVMLFHIESKNVLTGQQIEKQIDDRFQDAIVHNYASK